MSIKSFFEAGLIWKPTLVALAATTATQLAGAGQRHFYAGPNAVADPYNACTSRQSPCTLEDARKRARDAASSGMDGNIFVNVIGGLYRRTSPFELTAADSGRNGFDVIYQGILNDQGESPVFTGGKEIPVSGWYNRTSFWEVSLPTQTRFRELYINCNGIHGGCQRAIRARKPNKDAAIPYLQATPYKKSEDASFSEIRISPSDIPTSLTYPVDGTTPPTLEMSFLAHWRHPQARVQSFTGNAEGSTTIVFKPEEQGDSAMLVVQQNPGWFHYENDRSFMDAPGEWYLDKTRPDGATMLYYKPLANQTLATVSAVYPQTETLLSIVGTNANPARHIQVRGIGFRHTNWSRPETKGYVTAIGAAELHTNGWEVVPGALLVREASHIRIEQNTFYQTGAHAVLLYGSVQDTDVVENTFDDIGAGGVAAVRPHTDVTRNPGRLTIASNRITNVGQNYSDAGGIWVWHADGLVIEHNEIRGVPYAGIGLGGTDTSCTLAKQASVIRHNHLRDTMQLHDDGAAFYTVGTATPVLVTDNLITDVRQSAYRGGYPIAGFYIDNCGSAKTIDHNVVQRTSSAIPTYNVTYTQKLLRNSPATHDNVFQRNYYNVKQTLPLEGAANTWAGSNQYVDTFTWAGQNNALKIIGGAGQAVNEFKPSLAGTWTVYSSTTAAGSRFDVVDGVVDDKGWTGAPVNGMNPWLEIDLKSEKRIKKIEIVCKPGTTAEDLDRIQTNLSNFEIQVAAGTDPDLRYNTTKKRLVTASQGILNKEKATWTFVIPSYNETDADAFRNAAYRFLAINKTVAQSLQINEVRVYR